MFEQGNDVVKSAPLTLPNSHGKCQVYCMGIVGVSVHRSNYVVTSLSLSSLVDKSGDHRVMSTK